MSLISRISALATRIGEEVAGKCDDDDTRLSDNRTPSDTSVSYAKVASDLTGRITDNDGAWDFNAGGIIIAAFSSGSTSVSFSGLKQNKNVVVRLTIINSATFSLPAYCAVLEGSAEASGTNGTYWLYFHCLEDASGSEEVLVSITKEQA